MPGGILGLRGWSFAGLALLTLRLSRRHLARPFGLLLATCGRKWTFRHNWHWTLRRRRRWFYLRRLRRWCRLSPLFNPPFLAWREGSLRLTSWR
jgi:hypothetical protein